MVAPNDRCAIYLERNSPGHPSRSHPDALREPERSPSLVASRVRPKAVPISSLRARARRGNEPTHLAVDVTLSAILCRQHARSARIAHPELIRRQWAGETRACFAATPARRDLRLSTASIPLVLEA